MGLIGRRSALVLGATLLAAPLARKSRAEDDAAMFHMLSEIAAVPLAPPPGLAFTGLDGAKLSLAQFAGKPLVLNFWATWCAPCVAELPELDQLAAGGAIAVLAASADRRGADVVRPFLATHPITHATVLLDPASDAAHMVGVVGFPTSFVIDAQGRVRGRLEGPARWSGAAVIVAKMTA